MSMYGQKGRELLLELKRSDWLPPYNDELVRECLQEMQLHFDELQDQISASSGQEKPPMEARPSLLLHDAAIRRNKQCLLAYHVSRLHTLQEEVNSGTAAHNSTVMQSLMAEAEMEYLAKYEQLRTSYGASMGLDLRASILPPEQDLIQVRVLTANLGTLVTTSGASVNLQIGTIHYLSRTDVEPLIRQGFMEQVDGEEEG